MNNIIIKNAAQVVTCSGFEGKRGAEMSDLQIKKANIHTNVFIKADRSLLNAIENITVNANIA